MRRHHELAQNRQSLKDAGETVLINIDLIDGLAGNRIDVDYIRRTAKANGIVSMKAILIVEAKRLGLMTVHRYSMMDSRSLIALKK